MDKSILELLFAHDGQSALQAASKLPQNLAKYPAYVDQLAKQFPRELAQAALDLAWLRHKARDKFAHAQLMYFDREGLEMSTDQLVADERAKRFRAYQRVADLGCGIGSDAMALARNGLDVTLFDHDPVRLLMALANLTALGLTGTARCEDFVHASLEGFDAIFADPGRRPDGRRVLAIDAYEPAVSAIVSRVSADFPLAIKLAPGVARSEIRVFNADAEFVSLHGELKECTLWFGPFRTGQTCATLLPGPHRFIGEPGDPADYAPLADFVILPDPCIVRADLVGALASELQASPIEPGYATLTSQQTCRSVFAKCYHVEDTLPLDVRRIGQALQQRQVGRVTVMKRGVDIDVNVMMKKWHLEGEMHQHMIVTIASGKRVAILCQPVEGR